MKRIFTPFLLAFTLAFGTGVLHAQTTVPALIQSNQTWDLSGSPYLITQNTLIDSGYAVTILPGVEVISNSSNNTLYVDGELRAEGKVDSLITFTLLQIRLQNDANGYDSATNTGCYFNYCHFNSPGTGKRMLYVDAVDVLIENSSFWNMYYGIYSNSGVSRNCRLDVYGCTFIDSNGYSYPIYSSGTYNTLNIVGNTMINIGNGNGGGMNLYGVDVNYVGNTVRGMNQVAFYAISGNISCNDFSIMRSGVVVNIYAQDTLSNIIFEHNTLDSIGISSGGGSMLRVNRHAVYNLNQSRFNHNNFLTYLGTGSKVGMQGTNPNPSTSTPVDFKNNYWVSTDSSTIEGYINDYADNINLFGRVDFSNVLSAKDTSCGDTSTSSCQASFYVAVDTNTLFNVYVINNSTGTTGNTSYTWDFGDNQTSNSSNPTHNYQDYGKFRLCLTIYNQAENCSSTYCDSIGLDSNGNLMKNGWSIHVLNEWEVNTIPSSNNLENIKVYPNPSQGIVILDMGEASTQATHIRVIDMTGKLVYSQNTLVSGKHQTLNLSGLQQGIYLLSVQQGDAQFSTKIVISQ